MAQKKEKSSKEESNYHHGELKKALILAARKILRKQGVQELSLRGLAREIGVSQMAPYAHFKDKQTLLEAIASSGYEDLSKKMVDAQKENPLTKGRDLAFLYGVEYILFALENPDLYKLMLNQITPMKQKSKKEKGKEIWNASQRPFLLLFSAFADGKMPRDIAQVKALGSWSIVHGIATLAIEGHLQLPKGTDVIQFFKTTIEV
jgi:AcrR family transcriptional regulator